MADDRPAARACARRPSPAAILAVVGFSVFVAADDLTVVSTMLRPIIGDLGLVLPDGLDDAAWIVNAYLIAFVAVMPIAGRISDVIGRRRTFVGAYLLFLLGSIVIPLSTALRRAVRMVPVRPHPHRPRRRSDGAGRAGRHRRRVSRRPPGASARHARRDRDDGLGVGSALRRDARAPALVAVAVLAQHPARRSSDWSPRGGRSPTTTGRSTGRASTGSARRC